MTHLPCLITGSSSHFPPSDYRISPPRTPFNEMNKPIQMAEGRQIVYEPCLNPRSAQLWRHKDACVFRRNEVARKWGRRRQAVVLLIMSALPISAHHLSVTHNCFSYRCPHDVFPRETLLANSVVHTTFSFRTVVEQLQLQLQGCQIVKMLLFFFFYYHNAVFFSLFN